MHMQILLQYVILTCILVDKRSKATGSKFDLDLYKEAH